MERRGEAEREKAGGKEGRKDEGREKKKGKKENYQDWEIKHTRKGG